MHLAWLTFVTLQPSIPHHISPKEQQHEFVVRLNLLCLMSGAGWSFDRCLDWQHADGPQEREARGHHSKQHGQLLNPTMTSPA